VSMLSCLRPDSKSQATWLLCAVWRPNLKVRLRSVVVRFLTHADLKSQAPCLLVCLRALPDS